MDLDRARARALWEGIWAAGKTPAEHAKGRDLSAEAHRRIWTSLFARADAVVPGASSALYDRVMHPSAWRPYRDARPTLAALRARGIALGIVSNVGLDLRPVLRSHGMLDLIDTLALSYEHGAAKPAPSLFRSACAALGVPPERTLMVGDDPATDGEAGAAGLQVFVLPPAGPDAAAGRGLADVTRLVDGSREAPPGGPSRDASGPAGARLGHP